MSERIKMIATVIVVLVALLIGYEFRGAVHRCPECPKCPELVTRSHIERDSIVPHDTVRLVKYLPSIAVKTVPAVPTLAQEPGDSVVSYEVIDTMPDQAVIGFMIASKELPDKQIPDLTHTAWYVAKPDHIRIISDTLTVQLPPLKCRPTWPREIACGGICLGLGIGFTTFYFLSR